MPPPAASDGGYLAAPPPSSTIDSEYAQLSVGGQTASASDYAAPPNATYESIRLSQNVNFIDRPAAPLPKNM
jgi:hypothetical protein